MALHCTGNYASYEEAFQAALKSLESKAALNALKKLIALQ